VSALKRLTALRGIGPLVVVMACSALAQMTLHTIWVLYTSFKFGWGPSENGWSLFAVGVASALVQGVLLRHLIKRVSPQKLVVAGLVSSALGYLLWGLATEGWMMYAVMLVNMLGFTISVTLQGIVSNAADAKTQGQTLGALSSLNSLMAVAAPLVGAPLLALVSHLPQGDWRIGVPFFFCAALQAVALVFAIRHFARERLRASHALPTADAAP
jgi:DHA1 family tetracycline resistance protein-like MFS transporter